MEAFLRAGKLALVVLSMLVSSFYTAAPPTPAATLPPPKPHAALPEVAPQIFFNPRFVASPARSRQLMARHYLKKHARELHLAADLSDITYVKMKPSLLGEHYYFQQRKHGIDVLQSEVIVSMTRNPARIYRVFSHISGYQFPERADAAPQLSSDQAIAIAWKDLHAQGELLSLPRASLVYFPKADLHVLTYRVSLAVAKPYGYWLYYIDAHTGAILHKSTQELSRKARSKPSAPSSAERPSEDFHRVLYRYHERHHKITQERTLDGQVITQQKAAIPVRKTGRGLIFNPDPRTALLNPSLHRRSPADLFEDAYEEQPLRDLLYLDKKYLLSGPHVRLSDFEPPFTAPSVSTSGHWRAKRGDNAFYDVMTYFHIDATQRYIQQLGFRAALGIVNYALETDADGAYGDDNSHYVPELRRLAFGHGCVPDNEDATVIVHEYGHAIQFDINPNWSGGDTGAMGEGFGDYWAASYRLDTKNGAIFQPNRLFHWDSNGGDNPCWSGRILNASNARYQPELAYEAHQPIEEHGGFLADELWSTPLYQSLIEARRAGYQKNQVDRLLLEAHFGLGAGIKMRDMAKTILQTAQMMYGKDELAEIFARNFRRHHLISY